ncbi:metal-dependent hydrolase [Mucilaginibacter gynuensis]|uniref:UPF0173 metal-dependent hydrolase GCM10023149_00320 n=1 Tax=Mucilaginibacter gynuensis TaxID=1302236 RepID=A0ABP8FLX0_9SPHI
MKLTFYGHASVLIEIEGTKILFDPFISGNALAKDVEIAKIEADYIFISHGHGDHVGDLIEIAKKTGAKCVASAEIAGWLQSNGIESVHGMNHGGFIEFPFGKVKGVNAIHSSSFPDGSYAGNPLGFVFVTPSGSFYYAGDTALTMDMKLIPLWAKLDFAVLPIGGNYTMDVTDAIYAADFVECNKIVGIHYNTFPAVTIDTDKAVEQFTASGKTLLLPQINETIEL